MENRITDLLGIKYPIISGGMVWCSGWRLASAVSISGGLGLLGAGSMHPEVLDLHIERCAEACAGTGTGSRVTFGVNVPLFYPELERLMEVLERHLQSGALRVVVTSGGNPALYTARLKAAGATVIHVVANTKFALKAEAAGCDAVVVEGFEAGGHNGKDELTTIIAVADVCRALHVPVISAGGIGSGAQMLAAMALGAEGVQVGSRFAMCEESSAHQAFKQRCRDLDESGTVLCLKKLTPARLIRNEFCKAVLEAESRGASADELRELLGHGRAKEGMFLGDMAQGELEIGQVAASIHKAETARDVVEDIVGGYRIAYSSLRNI